LGHKDANGRYGETVHPREKPESQGRFPANVMLSHHPDCKKVGETEETIIGGNKGKSGFAEGYESGDFTKTKSKIDLYDCDDDCAVSILDEQQESASRFFYQPPLGRFPANVMVSHHPDCKKVGEVKDKVAKNVSFDKEAQTTWMKDLGKCSTENVTLTTAVYDCHDDCAVSILKEQQESASRFFYCPKVNKKERNAAGKNTHPTVKPIALMKYLVKLITPQGGKVLDPFMGSGSTGMACAELGNSFIGMEREEEYYEIAKARLEHNKENKDAS